MKESGLVFSAIERQQLKNFLRLVIADKGQLDEEMENKVIKKAIFQTISQTQTANQNMEIVNNFKHILIDNDCFPQIRKTKKYDFQIAISKLGLKLIEQEMQSKLNTKLINMLQQCKYLGQQSPVSIKMRLESRTIKQLQFAVQILLGIDRKIRKTSEDSYKMIHLLQKIVQNSSGEYFDEIKSISNQQLQQSCRLFLIFIQTQCVHLNNKSNPFNELIEIINNSSISNNEQILLKLKRLPIKLRETLQPFCLEIIRLRQSKKQPVNLFLPPIPPRNKSRTTQYMKGCIKKTQEDSIQQLINDFSISQHKNQKLENELNDIKLFLVNLNRISSSVEICKEIERSLTMFDEETQHTLGIIYKKLYNYVEMQQENQRKIQQIPSSKKELNNIQENIFKEQKGKIWQSKLSYELKYNQKRQTELSDALAQITAEMYCVKEELAQKLEENLSLKAQINRIGLDKQKLEIRNKNKNIEGKNELKNQQKQQIDNLYQQIKELNDKNHNLILRIQDFLKNVFQMQGQSPILQLQHLQETNQELQYWINELIIKYQYIKSQNQKLKETIGILSLHKDNFSIIEELEKKEQIKVEIKPKMSKVSEQKIYFEDDNKKQLKKKSNDSVGKFKKLNNHSDINKKGRSYNHAAKK